MLAIMGPDVTNAAETGKPAQTLKIASPRGAYRCADGGWVSLSGSTDSMARRAFEAIGRPELIEDRRFSTNAARLAHDDEVEAMLRDFFGRMEREAALALLRARGVTVGPILDAATLLRDRHVAARGVYVQESSTGTVMHAVTPRLEGTPGGLRRLAPRCGEHSAEVLGELGAAPGEVAALAAKRAVRSG